MPSPDTHNNPSDMGNDEYHSELSDPDQHVVSGFPDMLDFGDLSSISHETWPIVGDLWQ